ncbi:MAG TPA: DUF6580 family putative transport protein [Candidatus Saccharimonadales bacterium]|nr:DUF6580 family putative transport protein [Candidatus Saccharimonadales bacterium]
MLAILMIIGAVVLRLIPHIPNFAPITAIGLFGGRYVNKKFAILVPLIVMILSDYFLLYINPFNRTMDFTKVYPITSLFRADTLFVWSSFVISSLIGIWLRKTKRPAVLLGATLLASLQFFLITNFGVWAVGMYSRGLDGLVQSYVMGILFFRWTILGDLFYTGVFFGAYELATKMAKLSEEKILI